MYRRFCCLGAIKHQGAVELLLKPLVWRPAAQQELPKAHKRHSSIDADMDQVLHENVMLIHGSLMLIGTACLKF